MKRLTTDNPQGCFEKLMNFAYAKYNRVHLSYADGEDDIDLCKYVSKLAKAKGFDYSPEYIMEDGLFYNYDDDFAVLYYLAVQAAELRSRLKLYEDKLENGTLIELPCKVGTELFLSDYLMHHHRLKEYKFIGNRVVMVIECFEFQRTIKRFVDEHFGKTVFLTKKEAEVRLKEAEIKLKELNDER